jgi:hypothetical protein
MLYFYGLEDLPLEKVVAAMKTSARTCTFMPKPADLRKLVVGDPADTVEAAWLEFKRQVQVVGGYADATFTDGALAATLVAIFGSWHQACAAEFSTEVWVAKRREFERVYRVMRDRELGPTTLDGFCRRTNRALGYDDADARPSARLLGDGLSRRRIVEASDATRDLWRQNVRLAIEARAGGSVETSGDVSAMTPLARVAAETCVALDDKRSTGRVARESLRSRLARLEDVAADHEGARDLTGSEGPSTRMES